MNLVILFLELLFLFFHTTSLTPLEDPDTFHKRAQFYSKAKLYSNNKVIMGNRPNTGLSCIANDFIDKGIPVFQIPKNLTLSPFYLFPFKFEFFEWLYSYPKLKDNLGKGQRLSVFLLTYMIVYYSKGPKKEVMEYIHQNNLTQYYNSTEIDEEMFTAFPRMVLNEGYFEKEHHELLEKFKYKESASIDELLSIFYHVAAMADMSTHAEIILPWITDYEDFRWAYSIVMSRAMTMRIEDYFKLISLNDTLKLTSEWDKHNWDINQIIGKDKGVPCIFPFADLCNHYQPKFEDLRDFQTLYIDCINDYFLHYNPSIHVPGQEIQNSYTNDPSNFILMYHYGFILKNNIFNSIKFIFEDQEGLSAKKLNLCKEISCAIAIDQEEKKPIKKFVSCTPARFDQSLLSYARVKFLEEDFDNAKAIRAFHNDKPISYTNEIKAWIYYFHQIKKAKLNFKFPQSKKREKMIYKARMYQKASKKIEQRWKNKNDEKMTREWRRLKIFENIYRTTVSLAQVFDHQINLSMDNIIRRTFKNLKKMRRDYLY